MQDNNWQRLTKQIAEQHLPHALLLHGEHDTNKLQFALKLAGAILCQEPISGVGACGNCRSCHLYAAETHPDLFLIEPEEGKKNIPVDAIRELITELGMTAQQGGKKVAIITPAELMNRSSANSLLKTLEEPTVDTTIILISSAIEELLPTIRSRCQLVKFTLPAQATNRNHLTPEQQQLITDELNSACQNVANIVTIARAWSKTGVENKLKELQIWFVEYAKQQAVKNSISPVVFEFADQLTEAVTAVRNNNPNPQLLIEGVLIAWVAMVHKSNRVK